MGRKSVVTSPRSDYSLVGKDTDLAIKQGLADAKWYTSPVPKEKMRALLERRDGPAAVSYTHLTLPTKRIV